MRKASVKAVVLYRAYDQALISITKKNPLFVPLVQNFMLLYREGEQNSNELQTILHILKRDIISCFLVKFRNSTVHLGYFIVLERTVRCSRTVRVLEVFGRFDVRFWA